MNASSSETVNPAARWPVATAIAFFIAWTLGTWLLEGRIDTLLRPDALGARMAYALGVNIVFGIGIGGWLLKRLVTSGELQLRRSGLRAGARTAVAVVVGLGLGVTLYALQGAPTWDPMVLANAFAQVLVVSIAEVVVCWLLVANVVRESLEEVNRWVAPVVGAVVASGLFGLYHFAHSAPFDTWSMVGLLSVVGLLTSAFYFVSRDVWGTVAFHNMLAVYGVVGALVEQGATEAFETPVVPLFVTATVAVATLAGVQIWIARADPE